MYLKSLALTNVKGFKSLHFDLTRPDQTYAGWTVFLGGNASGKSTLLKSVALALTGPDVGRQLMTTQAGWIHEGERRAEILLGITRDSSLDSFTKKGKQPGGSFEIGVRWVIEVPADHPETSDLIPAFRAVEKRAGGTRVQTAERGPWNPNAEGWFSAGYGPMRRLSGSSSESIRFAVTGGAVSRYVTLFREDAALSESEEWLRRYYARTLESKDSTQIQLLAHVKELLSDDLLPHGMKISRIMVDRVFVKDKSGTELPMRDISDGCRSVYATVLDLVHSMFDVYGGDNFCTRNARGQPIVDAPGIVLIDEIEAHLHPAWQRDIPNWLKVHFPKIQFLVTTHSPLVAQAADPNGIFVLPSQYDLNRQPRALNEDEYEKIRWGRAEKTLLGVAFGLSTTRSEWANRQIEYWKKLNSKKKSGQPLTGQEQHDFDDLHEQLNLTLTDMPPQL